MSNHRLDLQGRQIIIAGKVQGVFFRLSSKELADKLDLTGWVCNLANGNVKIKVYGSTKSLQKFTDWCRAGPINAQVAQIKVATIKFAPHQEFIIT